MDLRWRLLACVLGFALLVLAAGAAWTGIALREDVAKEMEASTRLVELMRVMSAAPDMRAGELRTLLESGHFRHVSMSVERSNVEQLVASAKESWLSPLVDYLLEGRAIHEQRIPLGDGVLVVRADPASEVHEILMDAARFMLTLLVCFAAMAALAWTAADRALRPARALEQALGRLGRDDAGNAPGNAQVAMPAFELKEFAAIAAAIEGLSGKLAGAREARQQLTRQLLALQESERRDLARELHDEFGQALTAMSVSAALIERQAGKVSPEVLVASARDIREESSRMLGQVRTLLSRLRPHGLEGAGMADAIAELVDGWRSRTPQIGVELDIPQDLPPLAPLAGLALYRTLQESLTNVLRHSVASQVCLSLRQGADGLDLIVQDNGVGQVAEVTRRARGGLLGMHERAEMAGGRCWLADAPGGGLQVHLRLPLLAAQG